MIKYIIEMGNLITDSENAAPIAQKFCPISVKRDFVIIVIDFLDFKEKLRLQLLNRYFYETRIPMCIKDKFMTGESLMTKKVQQVLISVPSIDQSMLRSMLGWDST